MPTLAFLTGLCVCVCGCGFGQSTITAGDYFLAAAVATTRHPCAKLLLLLLVMMLVQMAHIVSNLGIFGLVGYIVHWLCCCCCSFQHTHTHTQKYWWNRCTTTAEYDHRQCIIRILRAKEGEDDEEGNGDESHSVGVFVCVCVCVGHHHQQQLSGSSHFASSLSGMFHLLTRWGFILASRAIATACQCCGHGLSVSFHLLLGRGPFSSLSFYVLVQKTYFILVSQRLLQLLLLCCKTMLSWRPVLKLGDIKRGERLFVSCLQGWNQQQLSYSTSFDSVLSLFLAADAASIRSDLYIPAALRFW